MTLEAAGSQYEDCEEDPQIGVDMVTTVPIMCDLLVMYNPPCGVQKCKVCMDFNIDAFFVMFFCKIKFVIYQTITIFLLSICSLRQNSDLYRFCFV
jgi:hypothetical protein